MFFRNKRIVIFFIIFISLTNYSTFSQTREIAITIDDLPVVSRIQDEIWQLSLTDSLLKHLKNNKVPATGFVIKDKLFTGDSPNAFQINLLKRWLDAGMELGSHTFSHPSLNKIQYSEYIDDINKGEEVFSEIKANYKPVHFRYPFLHTGRDSITRTKVEKHLNKIGYKIAPVSIDNADYIYARAYETAIMKNDEASRIKIGEDYVSYMTNVVEYYEDQSRKLLGYELKQILLLHANKLNSDYFDNIAEMLLSRGYSFIELKDALKDPAYSLLDSYFGPAGISSLHRWALTQGKKGEFFKGEPEVPEFVNKIAEE